MIAGGKQLAHQRADIGLEHAGAHDHRAQTAIEEQEVQPCGMRRRRAGRGQQEVGASQHQQGSIEVIDGCALRRVQEV